MMTHTKRKRSESGFYHVVAKGDGGQIVFECNAHRRYYLKLLETSASDHAIEVHAYCLMSNHIHLLVKDSRNELSAFMKQLNERYAMYFAKETGRVGHVFQSRFWSEPVETDEYYLATLRYIHANPEPAGMCRAKDYPWSSYSSYVNEPSFVTTKFALGLLGGEDVFKRLHASPSLQAKPFLKSGLCNHLTSDELVRIAASLLNLNATRDLKPMKPRERFPYLAKLKQAGLSENEIARITGIGKTSIHRTLS